MKDTKCILTFDKKREEIQREKIISVNGLIEKDELPTLLAELKSLYAVAEKGEFIIEEGVEDVHSQVEFMLTEKLGDLGKKIHSGRSRNDQVALDFRLYVSDSIREWQDLIKGVVAELDAGLETEDYGKKETIKAAKKQLAKEYFGEDCDGFKKVARGHMSKDEHGENTGFANNLSKENKERLDSRLESFYDQHIKPLFK